MRCDTLLLTVTMCDRKFVERGDDDAAVRSIDQDVKNKWNWKWMEREVDGCHLSDFIRKLDKCGLAFCVWCSSEIKYGSNGAKALMQHCSQGKHTAQVKARKTNYKLPGKLTIDLYFNCEINSVFCVNDI